MEELEGKVAIVTGGGSGIGKGAALKLAEHGAKVAIVDRDSQRAERARAEIERMGREALALEADVASGGVCPIGDRTDGIALGATGHRFRECGH